MALRRELLPLLLAAAFLLIGPAQALAAPTWLDGEGLDAFSNQGVPADVAADAEGNAVAVWVGNGEVRAAYRPRGGEWGPPENLDPGVPIVSTQPRVTVQPDGEFVAVWGAQGAVEAPSPVRWARRPSGGGWSAPDTITFTSSFPAISALEAGGDGSVTVMITDGDSVTTNRKAPGTETWGGDEGVPTGLGSRLAVGSDGSALAAAQDTCGVSAAVACVRATYRPPGGPWGAPEDAGLAAVGNSITGH